jgi:magnesium transporter
MQVSEKELQQPVTKYLTPVETTIRADQTLGEALVSLRRREFKQNILYFYVVDAEERFVGVVPTRKLLLGDPSVRIDALMAPPISLPGDATLELALEEFAMHRLLALPVVDERGRLIGTIDVRLYAEGAQDLAEVEHQSDVFQLIGVRLDASRQRSPWTGYRLRMPWLACNMVGGLLCAVIAAFFEEVLDQVVVLAMFIPLVLTLSESISMQSMTLSLQYLHGPGVPWTAVGRRAKIEWPTAGLMALTSGLVIGVTSLLWGGGASPAGVIGLSIGLTMVAAATFGLLLPVSLHALKLDPKVASGPVVLMMTDVVTTAVYLGLATAWLVG